MLLLYLQLKVPFDANKLYATEILSILLQNTPENRKLLGEMDGIDVLLQQLAVRPHCIIYKQICVLYLQTNPKIINMIYYTFKKKIINKNM